ncbi:uncharacterized protein LOC135119213 [Helicoverpa armigera]|uniref:uncharacterized protein LOC135119213 n=1 Tax=Helicoverpa armigera TaxID=29058 RepID=UPI003083776B
MFYRALVLRTKVKENRYLIEYIEYGNTEVSNLENLYPCPLELSVQREPSLVSAVKLADRAELSAAARALLDQLKNHEELLLVSTVSPVAHQCDSHEPRVRRQASRPRGAVCRRPRTARPAQEPRGAAAGEYSHQ